MPSFFLTFRSFILALVLHVLAAALLVMSFDFTPKIEQHLSTQVNIVEAVTVDAQQVEAEVERLREQDRKEQRERERLEKQAADLKQQAESASRQRKAEEQKLAELQKKKEQEQKAREVEEKKLAEAKKQQEELERQRRLEEEKKRKEEEARKKKEAEAALKKQLEAEQKEREAAQMRADQSALNQYFARIQSAITANFNLTGLPTELSCVILIRMVPGGQVVSAQVVRSSGNETFDRRAEDAVNKASPLPVPEEARLFEKMREIRLTFKPGG